MHPAIHAKTHPDRAAYVMAGTGEAVTYRQLDERSNQGAHFFRSLGLKAGDVIAILMDNHPRYFEVAWAAQRCGLYYTCISSKLTSGEIEYIVGDCGAQALIVSPGVGPVVDELPGVLKGVKLYMVGEARPLTPASRKPERPSRGRRSPTRPPAPTCSIRRAPPAGRRASSRP